MQKKKKTELDEAVLDGKLLVNYGSSVLVLPRAVLEALPSAKKRDILVLLAFLDNQGASPIKLAESASVSVEEVGTSLAFWRKVGVLQSEDGEELTDATATDSADGAVGESEPGAKNDGKGKTSPDSPDYSSNDIVDMIETDRTAALMIDNCERAFGRIFRTTEISKILALKNYLGVSSEYIIELADYCAANAKKSIRYLETTAISLYDKGVRDEESIRRFVKESQRFFELEGRIRAMFGINMTRELTKKERSAITSWIGIYGYGLDEISLAYEITVDTIHEPSLNYANAILEKWYAMGLLTAEDIEDALKSDKDAKPTDSTSYDSDDFFEAALKRSYGETGATPELPAEKKPRRGSRKK